MDTYADRYPKLRVLELERGQPARELILDAFRRTGSLSAVAREFKISRPTLDKWLTALGGELRVGLEFEEREDRQPVEAGAP